MKLFISMIFFVSLFFGVFAMSSYGQQRPILTENVDSIIAGSVRLEFGVEFLQDKDFPLSGLNGDLTRIGVVGLRIGLANNVELLGGGVIQNYLKINNRYRPSVIPLSISDTATSTNETSGFFIGTKFKLRTEGERSPSLGFRFLVELPDSDQSRGIGTNQTNFYASVLTDKNFGKLNLTGNIGIGILPAPVKPFAQNDVVLYGFSASYKVNDYLAVVGEACGRQSTRKNHPLGTESDGNTRLGFRVKAAGLVWDIAGIRGIYKHSASSGVTVGITFLINKAFRSLN